MHSVSIHDVRFRRAAHDRCRLVVRGQTVGAVTRVPDGDRPGDMDSLAYRIDLFDSSRGPRFVDC